MPSESPEFLDSAGPLDPEGLLQHREFLRALARQLVGDEHLAEDVVQESFVAALTHPPRDAGALRSWLAQVVARRASNAKRGEARRHHRERAGARAESVPSAQEVSESLYAQRRLLAALDALHEPYKTTLYLRWYEGLPPREIARRMQVPSETVRSRVQRGLARLRAELDEEFGERERWALALWPLARREPTGGVAAATLGWTAAALLCAGGALWTLRPSTITPNSVRPAETIRNWSASGGPAESADLDARREALLPLAGDERNGEIEVAAPRVATAERELEVSPPELGGLFFELELGLPAGLRVEDLEAELFALAEPDEEGGTRLATSAGRAAVQAGRLPWVRLPAPPPLSLTDVGGRSSRLLSVTTADGRFGATAPVHALAGSYPVPVPLQLEARGALVVELQDESGAPIAHSELRVRGGGADGIELWTQSDAKGRARFPSLAPGSWRLSARPLVHASSSTVCEVVAGDEQRVSLTLERRPTLRVAGTLRSRTGAEIAPSAVRLHDAADPARCFLASPSRDPGGDGLRFDFGEVPRGEYVLLPPAGDPSAWQPAHVRIQDDERALRLERLDGAPARRLRLRAFDRDTGERLERFQSVLLFDRYGLGMRETARLETAPTAARPAPRATTFDGSPWPPFAADVPLHWLVERDGYLAARGDRRALRQEGEDWVLEVQLAPAWRATFWVGTLDHGGRRRPVGGVSLTTHAGRELGRSLDDGLLYLDLSYDPGRLELAADGWRVREWTGFRRGKPVRALEPYEIWLEAAD